MLVYLADYLSQFHSGFNVFQYLTLRTILGALTALLISFLVGPWMIRHLSFRQIGQQVRTDGPETHFSKAGTPTMGGALILVAIAVSTLLWADLANRYVWVVLLVTLAFGAIGWVDDYRKIVYGNSKGLSARAKYSWQSLAALAAGLYLFHYAQSPLETQLFVPFFKDVAVALGAWYVVLVYFVVVGSSNAVNLTDGLDGLAESPGTTEQEWQALQQHLEDTGRRLGEARAGLSTLADYLTQVTRVFNHPSRYLKVRPGSVRAHVGAGRIALARGEPAAEVRR